MGSTDVPPKTDIPLKELALLLLGIILEITITSVVKNIYEEFYYIPLILIGIILVILANIYLRPLRIKIVSIAVIISVVVGLGLYFFFTSRPAFSLNWLNFPFKEKDTFYVTDGMINSQGDLSGYSSFTISPLELEIVPHYSGKERFGNVVLRISGSSQTKDYPLWTDLDSAAQTKTVSLSLADIVTLSGIKVNCSEVATSLNLEEKPFQEARLTFQVIQLSKPGKPFKDELKMLVKNTPWIQASRIVGRNNTLSIDYSLKNLGEEATFHCRISIAKVVGVGVDNHDFWSGVDIVHYGPNCTPFVLKKDEVYTTNFPLNQNTLGLDLDRGRYLVQIYSYAERSDVKFANNVSYQNSGEMWVLSKEAQVLTFVVCNDPGKTCAQSQTFPLEQGHIKAFTYDSHEQTQNGYSYFVVYSRPVANRIANQYQVDYWIDPQKDGWIGLALVPAELLDVSSYNAIRFTMKLDNDAFPVWAQLSSSDGVQEINKRVRIGDGTYGRRSSDIQTVVIPLSAFPDIDWTSVSAINFVIDSYMVPDNDHHELWIADIEFIQQ